MKFHRVVAIEIFLFPAAIAGADVSIDFSGTHSAHELGDVSNAVLFFDVVEDGVVGASGLSWDAQFSTFEGNGSLASEASVHITTPSGAEFDLFGGTDFGFPDEEGTFLTVGASEKLDGQSVQGRWRLEFYELVDSSLNTADGIWDAGRFDLVVVPAPHTLVIVSAAMLARRRRRRADRHWTS